MGGFFSIRCYEQTPFHIKYSSINLNFKRFIFKLKVIFKSNTLNWGNFIISVIVITAGQSIFFVIWVRFLFWVHIYDHHFPEKINFDLVEFNRLWKDKKNTWLGKLNSLTLFCLPFHSWENEFLLKEYSSSLPKESFFSLKTF